MIDTSNLNLCLDELLRRRINANWLAKIIVGGTIALLGLYAAAWLLEHALVVTSGEIGLCLGITCVGSVLIALGWQDRKEQDSLRRQVARMRMESESLVTELVRMRKAGGPVYEYLAQQGFTDGELRQYLIGRAKVDAGC